MALKILLLASVYLLAIYTILALAKRLLKLKNPQC